MRENADQNNSEYGHFLHSGYLTHSLSNRLKSISAPEQLLYEKR